MKYLINNRQYNLLKEQENGASSQRTKQEIHTKVSALIKTLSSKMEPASFIKLFTGKATSAEEDYVVDYINGENDRFLSNLFGFAGLCSFSTLGTFIDLCGLIK